MTSEWLESFCLSVRRSALFVDRPARGASPATRKAPNLAQGRMGLKGTPWGKSLSAQFTPGLGGRTAIPRAISSRFTRPTVVSPKWKIEAASAA